MTLHAQGVWDVIIHGNVEERKDRMTLAAICQAVSEDGLLMLVENDLAKAAWETLQTMHVAAERVKEAKVLTLKNDVEAIYMKNGKSIDNFAMQLTMIVSNIHFFRQ